jgi:hypothetical protein
MRIIQSGNGFGLETAPDDFEPEVIIVAPTNYQERQDNLPLDDTDEVKKLIEHRYADNELAIMQYQSSGKTYLNVWQFDQEIPDSLIRIPESFLLAKSVPENTVLEISSQEDECYYLAQFKGLIYSAKQQGMINSVERFSFSTGLTIESSQDLGQQQQINEVMNALSSLTVKEWLLFTKAFDLNAFTGRLITYVTPAILVVAVYLLLSSAYLVIYENYLESDYQAKASQVGELLDIQNTTAADQQRLSQLVQVANQIPSTAGIWKVVTTLIDQAIIKGVNFRDGSFDIIGEAQAATEILRLITEHPDVSSAEFTTPIRKVRGLEVFNIKLQLRNQGPQQEETN